MTNPYTQHLLRDETDPALRDFVNRWDSFEALAIEIYRRGECAPGVAGTYPGLVAELRTTYPEWRETLEPYWRASRIKGKAIIRDPFAALLEIGACAGWVANQEALRLLPAARESINRCLTQGGSRHAW